MFKMIATVALQSLFLTMAQLFLKIAVKRFGVFSWTWHYLRTVAYNLPLLFSGISAIAGTVLWIYILRKYEFSIAYPLTSICYIFGIMAAQWILHEQVPATRWIGVGIIIIGVFFVAK